MDDVEITDQHDDEVVAFLRDRIIAFNAATTGFDDGRSLTGLVKDEAGEIVAGLDGFTWGGYAKVEWLWVSEEHRGEGLGRRLMEAAEREAASRGCHLVRVDTHTFQAPGFYEKLGYSVIGHAPGAPLGHAEVFFSKAVRAS
ncbi:MAG: GNAT family N-acetyltransferase [Acidimicrobiia bacterium]